MKKNDKLKLSYFPCCDYLPILFLPVTKCTFLVFYLMLETIQRFSVRLSRAKC